MNISKLLKNRVINYSNNNSTDNNYHDNILKYLDKKIEDIIKYNRKFSDLSTDVLYNLYIAITYKTKDNNLYKDVVISYKLHQEYIKELNNYLEMINNYEVRKYIYNLLNNITDNEIIITNELLQIITPFASKKYYLEKILNYNKSINEFKDVTFKNIDILQSKSNNNEKLILKALQDKLYTTYKPVYKFNKPELYIYNKLIELKNNNLICVFNHFTLPLSRNNKHPLYSDFLLLFNYNNKLIFGLIEYDGPSHYNSNYYRYTRNGIYCDILKNKFCINNNINILRIFDYDNNIDNKINYFIDCISNGNKCVIIPSIEHYNNLLNTK
jgi:hypothetical protein